ncbi:MAG: hypothetical protein UHP27_06645 [Muribaculaceae bacterium]|nr:hypothetical protein [Muribaculaceae bacterium]
MKTSSQNHTISKATQNVLIPTTANELSAENTYFVIENDLDLNGSDITVGRGSLLSFAGGRIGNSTGTAHLDLNGAPVYAGNICIFQCMRNNGVIEEAMTVGGFSNSEISAEWFDDGVRKSTEQDECYVNRALVAANGCPVLMSKTTYKIKNTIAFPNLGNQEQTLRCPGMVWLKPSSDGGEYAAFRLESSYINLTVGVVIQAVKDYFGTGIHLAGRVFYSNIKIIRLVNLSKGVDFTPEIISKTYTDPTTGELSVEKYLGAFQYNKLSFDSITADKAINVDIYKNSVYADEDGVERQHWSGLAHLLVTGGRLSGGVGVYVAPPSGSATGYSSRVSGITFNHVGFEGITDKAIEASYASHLTFRDTRMNESLPGLPKEKGDPEDTTIPWIVLDNVSNMDIRIKTFFVPSRIVATGNSYNITVRAHILDNAAYIGRFDRIHFRQLNDEGPLVHKPKQVVSTALSPYNMAKTVEVNEKNLDLTLNDVMPRLGIIGQNQIILAKYSNIEVIPQCAFIEFTSASEATLNLAGLEDYAPCIIDLFVNLNNLPGANLTLLSFYNPSDEKNEDFMFFNGADSTVKSTKATIETSGCYRLNWVTNSEQDQEEKWVLRINKIS